MVVLGFFPPKNGCVLTWSSLFIHGNYFGFLNKKKRNNNNNNNKRTLKKLEKNAIVN